MPNLFASEAAISIPNEAVQIHGAYQFIKDYPVEKFYRDVKLCTIGEGNKRNPEARNRAAVAKGLNLQFRSRVQRHVSLGVADACQYKALRS